MAFKMKGTKFYGKGIKSPLKNKISKYATTNKIDKNKQKSDLTLAKNFLTNPTDKLSLKGNVNIFKNKLNLGGSYKLNKNTTLSGGVNLAQGKKPKYNVGLKINI